MQKGKGVILSSVLLVLVISVFSFGIVSAGWFSEITGKVTSAPVAGASCSAKVYESVSYSKTSSGNLVGSAGRLQGSALCLDGIRYVCAVDYTTDSFGNKTAHGAVKGDYKCSLNANAGKGRWISNSDCTGKILNDDDAKTRIYALNGTRGYFKGSATTTEENSYYCLNGQFKVCNSTTKYTYAGKWQCSKDQDNNWAWRKDLVCSDSDNGQNFSVKGKVNVSNVISEDKCNGTKIIEYYCGESDQVRHNQTTCQYGCNEGRCKDAPTQNTQCSDTDGGENYFEKGTTMGLSASKLAIISLVDNCTSNTNLTEYACNSDQTVVAYDNYVCPAGCFDGACNVTSAQRTSSCLDDDGGKMYNLSGTTIAIDSGLSRVVKQDYCSNATTLKESYCNSTTNNSVYEIVTCSGGCFEGECLEVIKQGQKCNDSDEGLDFYTAGVVKKIINGVVVDKKADYCKNSSYLREAFCNQSVTQFKLVKCDDGCSDDACNIAENRERKCKDSDGGIKYGIKGNATQISENNKKVIFDTCNNSVSIKEAYCTNESKVAFKIKACSSNCTDGVCYDLKAQCGESECVLNNKCFSSGARKSSKYCNGEEFVDQRKADAKCSEDFECKSGECLGGKCLSQSALNRLMQWLKGA
jgi:hypothetical protein